MPVTTRETGMRASTREHRKCEPEFVQTERSRQVSTGRNDECCKPVTVFKSGENSGCADVLLTRRAANKEVQYDALVKSQQVRVDAAMTREWDKWNEFGVTKLLSKKQLNDIMKRNPDQKIVGTRWVFTEKVIPGQARRQGSTGRARVSRGQGIHQNRCAHWIARRLLHDALSSSSKRLGLQRVRCSVSVPSVRRHRETIVVADASQKSASWDEARASVCCYWFRSWSQGWEQGVYFLHRPSGLEAAVHTHVDDFLSAFKKVSKKYKDAL